MCGGDKIGNDVEIVWGSIEKGEESVFFCVDGVMRGGPEANLVSVRHMQKHPDLMWLSSVSYPIWIYSWSDTY